MTLEKRLKTLCAEKPLPCDEFMRICLYSTEGYYFRSHAAPGRGGDYFTSVSVGEEFGWLLAQNIIRLAHILESHPRFFLIEQGAHHGTLANDIVNSICQEAPELLRKIQLIFVEPLPHLRAKQAAQPALQRLCQPVFWVSHPSELPQGWSGVFYCNELLDAFPVKRFLYQHNTWWEMGIRFGKGVFQEVPLGTAPTNALTEALLRLPLPSQEEIREWRPGLYQWFTEVMHSCSEGAMLVLDYGPMQGPVGDTTRAFQAHRQVRPWYSQPGSCDITADVDFELLGVYAQQLGLLPKITPQGVFLTQLLLAYGAEQLAQKLGVVRWRHWCRRFLTLTHPEHLGQRFVAFYCEKNLPEAACWDVSVSVDMLKDVA